MKNIIKIAEINGYKIEYGKFAGHADVPYVINEMGTKTFLCIKKDSYISYDDVTEKNIINSIYYGYEHIGELLDSYQGGE